MSFAALVIEEKYVLILIPLERSKDFKDGVVARKKELNNSLLLILYPPRYSRKRNLEFKDCFLRLSKNTLRSNSHLTLAAYTRRKQIFNFTDSQTAAANLRNSFLAIPVTSGGKGLIKC